MWACIRRRVPVGVRVPLRLPTRVSTDTTILMVIVIAGFVVIAFVLYMVPYILVMWHCDQALYATTDWERGADLAFYIALPIYICMLIVYTIQRKMQVEVVFRPDCDL